MEPRFWFPNRARELLNKVKNHCQVCAACDRRITRWLVISNGPQFLIDPVPQTAWTLSPCPKLTWVRTHMIV